MKFATTALILSLLSPAGATSGLTLPELLSKIEEAQRQVEDIQFKFVQRVQQAHGFEQTVAGRVFFRRPHWLRVSQLGSQKQTLISDGDKLWLYVPSARQQLTGSWKAWVEDSGFPSPLLSFVGDFPVNQWHERYKVLFGGYKDSMYRLTFQPKAPGDSAVDLWISDATFLPKRGKMRQENVTVQFSFQDVKTNQGIDSNTFSTAVPSGTAVVPLPS
jgi:chaperone LolA